jgi:hypothetical protein
VINPGTILFLKRRELSLNPLSWISLLISAFQGKYTHTAIVFKTLDGILRVREMTWKGLKVTDLNSYFSEYRERLVFIMRKNNFSESEFNLSCGLNNCCYDYNNLLFFQVVYRIFGLYFFDRTDKMRTCSQDTAEQYNLIEKIFEDTEKISPNELYLQLTKNIKNGTKNF